MAGPTGGSAPGKYLRKRVAPAVRFFRLRRLFERLFESSLLEGFDLFEPLFDLSGVLLEDNSEGRELLAPELLGRALDLHQLLDDFVLLQELANGHPLVIQEDVLVGEVVLGVRAAGYSGETVVAVDEVVHVEAVLVGAQLVSEEELAVLGRPVRRPQGPVYDDELVKGQDCDCGLAVVLEGDVGAVLWAVGPVRVVNFVFVDNSLDYFSVLTKIGLRFE